RSIEQGNSSGADDAPAPPTSGATGRNVCPIANENEVVEVLVRRPRPRAAHRPGLSPDLVLERDMDMISMLVGVRVVSPRVLVCDPSLPRVDAIHPDHILGAEDIGVGDEPLSDGIAERSFLALGNSASRGHMEVGRRSD